MALNSYGVAFGDADTGSGWRNPSRYAWDDFDWIRYACEKADDEDEAVELLTKDVVDKLHASAVSENLFVVGPEKAFLVEADAFRYHVKEIDDVLVMSNYPKELWRTQLNKKLIASSFNIEKETLVREGGVVRLNSLLGVEILDIGDGWILVTDVSFSRFRFLKVMVRINVGERATVGDYSVRLLGIEGDKARVSVCYVFKAWEEKMLEHIYPRYGRITVKDMMNWSRLHEEDLEGLRPMCEDLYEYEGAMIFCIPGWNYNVLSGGWFAANHACSSIYVPVHISNLEVHEPYTTGEAARLSLELLNLFGHETLIPVFSKVENVFLWENMEHEKIAETLLDRDSDVSEFLTVVDMGMQRQGFLTLEIWRDVGRNHRNDEVVGIIGGLWRGNYSASLDSMFSAVESLRSIGELDLSYKVLEIIYCICESRLDAAGSVGRNVSSFYELYWEGRRRIEDGDFDLGSEMIKESFVSADLLLKGQRLPEISVKDDEKFEIPFAFVFVVVVALVILTVRFLRKH
jgi:hypothetical protein